MRVVRPVGALWRYPVKSMMGEEVNAAEVTERGLVGDRGFAVADPSTGLVAGAKNPRKWGNFFDFRAAYAEPPQRGCKLPVVRVTLPDGAVVTSDQPDLTRVLSGAIGDEVRLRITGGCPGCVMTTLPQADLPRDTGILRAAAQHNHADVGVYGEVIAGGAIRRGDRVTLI